MQTLFKTGGGWRVNTLADELELRSQVLQKKPFCSQLYLNDKIRLLFLTKSEHRWSWMTCTEMLRTQAGFFFA